MDFMVKPFVRRSVSWI